MSEATSQYGLLKRALFEAGVRVASSLKKQAAIYDPYARSALMYNPGNAGAKGFLSGANGSLFRGGLAASRELSSPVTAAEAVPSEMPLTYAAMGADDYGKDTYERGLNALFTYQMGKDLAGFAGKAKYARPAGLALAAPELYTMITGKAAFDPGSVPDIALGTAGATYGGYYLPSLASGTAKILGGLAAKALPSAAPALGGVGAVGSKVLSRAAVPLAVLQGGKALARGLTGESSAKQLKDARKFYSNTSAGKAIQENSTLMDYWVNPVQKYTGGIFDYIFG